MSTTTTTTTQTQTTLKGPQLGMALDGRPTNYNDFRDQLNRDGYAVIKGAVPRDRAVKYADKFLSYLEGLYAVTFPLKSLQEEKTNELWDSGLGFKRDDPSTVKRDMLPVLNEKGMILNYGVTHEQWVWDIRGEPGVIDAFAKVYGDEDLIVSFDVVNVGFAKYFPLHPSSLVSRHTFPNTYRREADRQ